MKKNNSIVAKINSLIAVGLMISLYASAQSMPEVTVDGRSASSWFSNNWLWIAIGVVVLLILLFITGSSRSKRTTTTVTDRNGTIQRSTTTETEA